MAKTVRGEVDGGWEEDVVLAQAAEWGVELAESESAASGYIGVKREGERFTYGSTARTPSRRSRSTVAATPGCARAQHERVVGA